MLLQIAETSHYHYQPSWVMMVIVLSIMLQGYLYSAFSNRFVLFFKAVFFSRYFHLAAREDRSLSHPVSLILSLNFLLTASLYVLQLFSSDVFFKPVLEFSFLAFMLVALVILIVYAVKSLFLNLLAFVLDKKEMIAEYNFTVFLVHQFWGVCLLPVVIFAAYGPAGFPQVFLLLGTLLGGAAFLLRVGKGLSAVLENREATLFYLILYLCTLEILPLLIGLKLLGRLI